MEVLMSQKEWPSQSKYIGFVVDINARKQGEEFHYSESSKNFCLDLSKSMESARRRVYGDEIELAKDRIATCKTSRLFGFMGIKIKPTDIRLYDSRGVIS